MPRNTLEQKLQKECIRIFHLFKPKEYGRLYMNHQNPKNAKNGRELKQMGLVPGIADLTYLSDNGIIFIELKVEKNKQTKSQVFWQNLSFE